MEKKAYILVVDDDPDILDTSRIILDKHGYEVQTAQNGQEAMRCLQQRMPDLMILDVMMTNDTEGFDLAYDLKENPKYKDLPIVMLTSFMDKVRTEGPGPFEFILGEQWPAHWLFEKPLEAEKLIAKIETILAER